MQNFVSLNALLAEIPMDNGLIEQFVSARLSNVINPEETYTAPILMYDDAFRMVALQTLVPAGCPAKTALAVAHDAKQVRKNIRWLAIEQIRDRDDEDEGFSHLIGYASDSDLPEVLGEVGLTPYPAAIVADYERILWASRRAWDRAVALSRKH